MMEIPDILYASPSEAWPWLLRRFPDVFDGINLSSEPYAHYLNLTHKRETTRVEQDQDLLIVARYFLAHLTLADISEALTGKREYGGAIYTRVKTVKKLLDTTITITTTTTLDLDYQAEIVESIA